MKDDFKKEFKQRKATLLEIRECFKQCAEQAGAMANNIRKNTDVTAWKVLDDRVQSVAAKITDFKDIRDFSLQIIYSINRIIEIESRLVGANPDFEREGTSDDKNKH